MLLESEIQVGEIYVTDFEMKLDPERNIPKLFQMVQVPTKRKEPSMFSFEEVENEINGIYENIVTGELVNYGTHCFSTIERLKKQYVNIDSIAKDRVEFVRAAYFIIVAYENSLSEISK